MVTSLSPSVYIIIPNTYAELHTIECLESVFKQVYDNYKVIVVDNSNGFNSLNKILAWCNGELEQVDTKYPELIYPLLKKRIQYKVVKEEDLALHPVNNEKLLFIKAKDNNGFSAANNVALKYILQLNDFDWVWLLNSDTVILSDCLKNFATGQSRLDKNIGIVGTKLIFYHKPGIYQGLGGKYNKWLGTTYHVAEGEQDNGQYDNVSIEKKVDYVIAASIFVSKPFLRSVGLMCEDYFFYFEEMDWTLRGKKKGWHTSFLPNCKVLHKEGGSTTAKDIKSMLVDVATVRNRVLFAKKFFPQYLPFVLLGLIGVIIRRIRRKQFDRIPILLKAVFTNQNPKVFVKPR